MEVNLVQVHVHKINISKFQIMKKFYGFILTWVSGMITRFS